MHIKAIIQQKQKLNDKSNFVIYKIERERDNFKINLHDIAFKK